MLSSGVLMMVVISKYPILQRQVSYPKQLTPLLRARRAYS